MKKKWALIIMIGFFLCFFITIMFHKPMDQALSTVSYQPLSGVTIVLDAGHGGKDNGAMSNDIHEQDINLKIVKKLRALLETAGANVQLTRDGNYDLASEGVGNRKKDDMKKRVMIINDTLPDIFLSIHLNAYPNTSVRGAQVFYQKDNEASHQLSTIMQEQLKILTKTKMIEKQGDYYILNETTKPGVLVECGFLSNANDRENLMKDSYQQELADYLFNGILEYFEIMV